MLVKRLHQLGEVGQRPGQPVDLVDHDHVDLAGLHILQEPLQRRALSIAAREPTIVISGSQQGPSGMRLAADISLRGVILGIE